MLQWFVSLKETGGVYVPFVPVEQAPNVHNHETPDTNCFVLGMTIAEHLELNQEMKIRKTGNGHFTFVEVEPGQRLIDSMIYGMQDNDLLPDTKAYLHIVEGSRNTDGELKLLMTLSGDGDFSIDDQPIPISKEPAEYEIILPYKDLYKLSAAGNKVQIMSYETAGNE